MTKVFRFFIFVNFGATKMFQKSFFGAEKLCASQGMHLAHLENKLQTDSISEHFKTIGI